MLLNIVAVALLLVIVLAIGVFIGKSLTTKTSGPTATPTNLPSDDTNSIVLPSGTPTLTATVSPNSTMNTSPGPSVSTGAPNATAVPSPSPTSSPTATPTVTPSPTVEATYYPTATPIPANTPTPSPTATPSPSQYTFLPDQPFYQNITPLKNGDYLSPADNSYIAGNGPVYIDLAHSNMGSDYAYPGDTIGVMLRLYNEGPAINTLGTMTINLSRMVYLQDGSTAWVQLLSQDYSTNIQMGAYGSTYKNISYTIPNEPGIAGFYKIYIMFYVNGQFTAGAVKELNIFE